MKAVYLLMTGILAAVLLARPCRAETFEGTVEAIQGDQVTILARSATLPRVGDRLEVQVSMPDVGRAIVATVVVTRVQGRSVQAKVERTVGQVGKGQAVRAPAAALPGPSPSADAARVWLGAFVRDVYRDQARAAGLDHPNGKRPRIPETSSCQETVTATATWIPATRTEKLSAMAQKTPGARIGVPATRGAFISRQSTAP